MTVWFAPTEDILLQEWFDHTRTRNTHSADLEFCMPYIDEIIDSMSYRPELLVVEVFRSYFTGYPDSTIAFHTNTGISLDIARDVSRGKADLLRPREFFIRGYWGEARQAMAYISRWLNSDAHSYILAASGISTAVDEWGLRA